MAAQLGFQGDTFLDQAAGEPSHTVYSLCGEAICGKPQQIQGKVRNVGKGLRESYIFPFAVLSERQKRECQQGAR